MLSDLWGLLAGMQQPKPMWNALHCKIEFLSICPHGAHLVQTHTLVWCAGILMYLAFVSLMAEDFIHSQHTRLGLIIKYIGILLGAAIMCVLAIWA